MHHNEAFKKKLLFKSTKIRQKLFNFHELIELMSSNFCASLYQKGHLAMMFEKVNQYENAGRAKYCTKFKQTIEFKSKYRKL